MTLIALLIIGTILYSLIKNEIFFEGLKKEIRIYIDVILCLGAGAISYQITVALILATKWNQLAQFAAVIVGIVVCVMVIDSKLN
jgi:hypothetical protein